MGVCDARYNFIYASIGDFGSNNDPGVLLNTDLPVAMENDFWDTPRPEKIDGIEESIPYFFIGDEIFPLQEWLMRPYPGTLPEREQIYNYRH